MVKKMAAIDFKSFLFGFLLAGIVFLALGAGSGVQEVRLVGISTHDALSISIDGMNSSLKIPIQLRDVDSSVELPVSIEDVDSSAEFKVKLKD